MKWNKFVVLLFLFSFSLNSFSAFYFPIKWWDETVYANLGYDLQKNPLDYSFTHGWGDRVFDWWDKAGFRPPLLPYIIAFVDLITNSNQFFVNLIIPFAGAVGAVLLYFLSKKLFNENIAIYSSLFLAFSPTYVQISGKTLTDILATTFTIAAFFAFWIGFEKKVTKFKYLSGFLIALAILSKYTSLIIIPTFFIFLVLRNKNLKFLKDKDLIISFLILLLTLSPLFIYGYFSYGTPLGAFIHAWRGASYWGGVQPWYFFIQNSFLMFSAIIFLFLIGFYLMLRFFKNEPNKLFVLTWFIVFLLFFSSLLHKEERFFLPLFPAFCIIAAFGLEKFEKFKKIQNYVFTLILLITLASTLLMLYIENKANDSKPVYCFYQSVSFLKNTDSNSVIFTDDSPIVYYYTHRESDFYTDNNGVKNLDKLISENFANRSAYVLWTLYGAPTDLRQILENDTNFKTVFSCPEDSSLAVVYQHI
jgi:4-amino-4-deoxy-L-arabinose transferase-like glycosyltransferase